MYNQDPTKRVSKEAECKASEAEAEAEAATIINPISDSVNHNMKETMLLLLPRLVSSVIRRGGLN